MFFIHVSNTDLHEAYILIVYEKRQTEYQYHRNKM